MTIYGIFLPSEKATTRIVLKSLLGVFMGGVLFALFLWTFLLVTSLFTDSSNFKMSDWFAEARMIFVGVILWTMMFASVPAMFGGLLLSAIIYRDFKNEKKERSRAIKRGILIAGCAGLSVSVFVAFSVFRPADVLPALRYAIPVTFIASLIGAWGGAQVHKEIETEFSSRLDVKENN